MKRHPFFKALFVVYNIVLAYCLIIRHIGVFHNDTWIEYLRHNTNFLPFFSVRILLAATSGFSVVLWRLLRVFVGNFLLFIPFGMLSSEVFLNCTTKRLVTISLVISLLIETLQILSCIGTFDIEVVCFRVFGSLLGFCLRNCIRHTFKRRSNETTAVKKL